MGLLQRRRRPQGKDPAAAAGAASPPLAWQDVDLRRGCGGNASVNADAVDDDDYNNGSGDDNGDDSNGQRRTRSGARARAAVFASVQWGRQPQRIPTIVEIGPRH
jgi:hypothetical protein